MEIFLGQFIVLPSGVESYTAYYDDVADEVIVRDDATSNIVLGPTLGFYGSDYNLLGAFIDSGFFRAQYQFCDDTTLVQFQGQLDFPSHPYFEKVLTANSPSCSASPVVCDLQLSNFPLVINASNAFTADGQITVSASSSNGDIEYSLSPFSFGSGQSSGVFPTLLPGTYTIYAVDEVGCTDSIQVTVGNEGISYNSYIFYEYMDKDKLLVHDIDVQRLGWNGDQKVVEKGSGTPVIYTKQNLGIHEKLGGVEGSELQVTLWANQNGEFRNLFTQNDRRYRVIWRKNEGAGKQEVWRGWIQPSIYSEPYITPPYEVMISCYDGLSTLDQFDFVDDSGNRLKGKYKVIEILALILRKLNLDLGIRVNCNIREYSEDESGPGIIWDQVLIDTSFYTESNCKQVLEDLLLSVSARVVQWAGYWWVTRKEDEIEEYTYREFTKNAVFVEADNFDPILEDYIPLFQNQVLEVIPAYGLVIIDRPLNERLSLIPGEFEKEDLRIPNDDLGGFQDWTFVLNGSTGLSLKRVDQGTVFNLTTRRRGEFTTRESQQLPELTEVTGSAASIQGQGSNKRNAFLISEDFPLQYQAGDFIELSFLYGLSFVRTTVPFWIIRFELKIGSKYLNYDLTWSNSPAQYRFYPQPSNGLNQFSLVVPMPDDLLNDSTISFKIFNYRTDPNTYEFASITALKALATSGIDIEYKTDVLISSGLIGFYELDDGTDTESSPDVIRPDDYDGSTNAKVWRLVRLFPQRLFGPGSLANSFIFDQLRVRYLPLRNRMPTLETIRINVLEGIRENKEITLNLGDIPDTFITNAKNSYNNVYFLPSGEVTQRWARDGVTELTTLQKIFANTFVTQYYRPMEKISGSWLRDNQISPLNTLVRLQNADAVTWLNPDFTSGFTGWTNSGWSLDTGAFIVLDGEVGSGVVSQAVLIPSFTRVKLSYDIERSLSDGIRNDVFEVLLFQNTAVLQVFTVSTMDFDQAVDGEISFTTQYDITAIGFRVRRVNGGGEARYEVYLFDIETVNSKTYYNIMGLSVNDKMNEYTLELAEIIPKSGDPNSEPGEEPSEGQDFSGDFNEDFGGDFDTILN